MAKIGRPSKYTPKLADKICEGLASGLTLRKIEKQRGMPSHRTILRWAASNETFRQQYREALVLGADAMAEETIDIADGLEDDPDAASRRVRCWARQWLVSKRRPRKYSDRVQVEDVTDPEAARAKLMAMLGVKDKD